MPCVYELVPTQTGLEVFSRVLFCIHHLTGVKLILRLIDSKVSTKMQPVSWSKSGYNSYRNARYPSF